MKGASEGWGGREIGERGRKKRKNARQKPETRVGGKGIKERKDGDRVRPRERGGVCLFVLIFLL